MLTNERPIGLALLLCDSVIQDKATNKRTLIGLFDRLASRHLPFVHQRLSVYISLTSGRGDYLCEVRCRHTDSATTIFAIKTRVHMDNPLAELQLVFNVAGARFTHAGMHWLEFSVDSIPIMMRRLQVVILPDSRPAESDTPDPRTETDA